jgi:hypothetical protein
MENNYNKDDYKKLLFELFYNANKSKCHLTIDFVNNNLDLLKKTVGNNNYGIPEGSTALHILALKEINYLLVSGYSSQTFFRNIYNDINTIIDCLHISINNKGLYMKLNELDIVNKKDVNGKTVMDIINENLDNSDKYLKLKDIIETINNESAINNNNIVDNKPYRYVKIVIDKDAIVSEKIRGNKKVLMIAHNDTKKHYRIFLNRFSKTLTRKSLKLSPLKKSRRRTVKRVYRSRQEAMEPSII